MAQRATNPKCFEGFVLHNIGSGVQLPAIPEEVMDDPSSDKFRRACEAVAWCLEHIGLVLFKPRTFSMVQRTRAFELALEYMRLRPDWQLLDERPQIGYQVGFMRPEGERAIDYSKWVSGLPPGNEPLSLGQRDRKLRFFIRVEDGKPGSPFVAANAPNVVPVAIGARWLDTFLPFGRFQVNNATKILFLAEIGFGVPQGTFTRFLEHGQHLVSLLGMNLTEHREDGVAANALHDDIGLIAMHTGSFPKVEDTKGQAIQAWGSGGLRAWTRKGRVVNPVIPRGHSLGQAGTGFAYLTGGRVHAGMHEVVTGPEHEALRRAAEAMGLTAFRIALPVFVAMGSDFIIGPQAHFATPDALLRYPPIPNGLDVAIRLEEIGMMSPEVFAAVLAATREWAAAQGHVDVIPEWRLPKAG